MRVRYLGDGDVDEEGRQSPCSAYGHVFPVGEWQEVDLPVAHAQKLSGNPMFEVKGVPEKAPDPDVEEMPEIPENWSALPFMTKRSLARKIDPSIPAQARADVVEEAIQAELDRRAGSPSNPY